MTKKVRRLLIANRGEIAVRIARAARDLSIETVGVHSDGDRESRHATVTDRSVCIGPPGASSSYLRGDLLVHVAQATGCDAVHPGYGFLSEDAGSPSKFAKPASCEWGRRQGRSQEWATKQRLAR
jgi:acetyl-CoA carboxylase biotin carboxylase subunit